MYGTPWPQILVGGLLCYFGHPLFEVSVLAFGFLAGGGLCLLVASYFGASGLVLPISVLAGGCAGMFLSRLFVRFGFLLVGSALGFELGGLVAPQLPLVVLGSAVVGAVLGVVASRRIIITITTLAGAAMFVRGGGEVLDRLAGEGLADGLRMGLFLFLVITGLVVQGWLARRA